MEGGEICACGTTLPAGAHFCPHCGHEVFENVPIRFGGLSQNFVGLLGYLIPFSGLFLIGIVPFNRSRFVRFHAFQGVYFWLLCTASYFLLRPSLSDTLPKKILEPVALSALAFVWIFCMVKAYRGEMIKLPVLGKWAESRARRVIL